MVANYTCCCISTFPYVDHYLLRHFQPPPTTSNQQRQSRNLRCLVVRTRNGHVNLALSWLLPDLDTELTDEANPNLINSWSHKDGVRLLYSTCNRLTAGERCWAIFPRHMLTFVLILGCSSSWHLAKCLSSWLLRIELLSLGARRTIDWSDRETQWIMSISRLPCLGGFPPEQYPNGCLIRFLVLKLPSPFRIVYTIGSNSNRVLHCVRSILYSFCE